MRAQYGLGPFAWTDTVLAPGATAIRAVHIVELRAALEHVYVAAGRSQPEYTDPTLIPGVTVMKVAHIAELRVAVLAIE